MKSVASECVQLDLNNPVFQRQLFALQKTDQSGVLNTLRKISAMTWQQIYEDSGLRWEAVISRKGPRSERLYSIRIAKGFRGVAFREQVWMRFISLHPDHDSAYMG
jgi:hypothetical protein